MLLPLHRCPVRWLTSPTTQLLPSELEPKEDAYEDWVSYLVFKAFVMERGRSKAMQTPEVEGDVPDLTLMPTFQDEDSSPPTLVRYDYLTQPGYLSLGQSNSSIRVKNAMELLTEIPRAFNGPQDTGFLIAIPDPQMSEADVWSYVTDQLSDDFTKASTGPAQGGPIVTTLYVGEKVQFRPISGDCSGLKACEYYQHSNTKRPPDDTRRDELAAALTEHRAKEVDLPMNTTIA
jgi:hypothetical protein